MTEIWIYLSENFSKILDVLIVAVLFYYLLHYARRTKLMVVLQAIILLGVLYLVFNTMHLDMLVFIIQAIFTVGLLALFIIFAPEIRQMLERAGKTSPLVQWLLHREEESDQSSLLDCLIDTCIELSESSTGALFVIERQDDVSEHLVPGTKLEAVPTQRLLASIFDTHNPMHDGAVVFKHERVHSAGSFLPISERTSLPKELGTRHRAAVGLTERCDAIVVVVSEETGGLSISFQGRLARNLKPEQFSEQVVALVEPNENFASLVPRESFI